MKAYNEQETLYGAICQSCRTWKIEERRDDVLTIAADFVFKEDFPGFAGHFPGNPVLPAVVQLAAVRCLAELALGKALVPYSYGRTKFKTVVRPHEPVVLQLVLRCSETRFKGRFSISKKDRNMEFVAGGQCELNTEQSQE